MKQRVDEALVMSVYKELGSNRETAKRLGISESTVIHVRRRTEGLCNRCGKVRDRAEFSNCANCREWLRKRTAHNRTTKKAAGICLLCTQPAVEGVIHCETHRQHLNEKSVQATAAKPKRAPNRPRTVFNAYGIGGIKAWARDGAKCVLCDIPHVSGERKIHIHHIDRNRENNAADNLACLCWCCHRVVHLLMEHPEPRRVLTWLRQNTEVDV